MTVQTKIRISKEFKDVLDYIRGKCFVYHGKMPSITKITEVIAKNVNKEKLWQTEFAQKQKRARF